VRISALSALSPALPEQFTLHRLLIEMVLLSEMVLLKELVLLKEWSLLKELLVLKELIFSPTRDWDIFLFRWY